MASGRTWAFKTKLRARAFGWRGSQTAIVRLKEAVSEIAKAAKTEGAPKKRVLSAAARKRIAAAQKKRWAEHRKRLAAGKA